MLFASIAIESLRRSFAVGAFLIVTEEKASMLKQIGEFLSALILTGNGVIGETATALIAYIVGLWLLYYALVRGIAAVVSIIASVARLVR